MSRGRNYIINENDMKVILNAIHWNCLIYKTECDWSGEGEKREEIKHPTQTPLWCLLQHFLSENNVGSVYVIVYPPHLSENVQ